MRSGKAVKLWCYTSVPLGILLVIRQLFHILWLGPPITFIPYLYLLIALFLPGVFLLRRVSDGVQNETLPWYDGALAILSFLLPFRFVLYGDSIILEGWEVKAPFYALVFSLIVIGLLIEASRRIGGTPLAIIVILFTFYPLVAEKMPGPLWGAKTSFSVMLSRHAFSTDSILGVPLRAVGTLIVGFLVFASALLEMGGGKFLVNICMALLGTIRGGAAKVGVISSGLCGMISGTVVGNVITTGSFTIPMMKKTGYPGYKAGAIEACSSTGGPIMPPIMGSVAFIAAEILQVPYSTIALAAFPPAFFYFTALLLGVDAIAVKSDLKGLPRKDLPKVSQVIADGWVFLVPIVALVYLLLVEELEAQAPFYSVAAMILLLIILRRIRWTEIEKFLISTGDVISELIALLGAVGLIVGSLSMTGVSVSVTQELVDLAGTSVFFLLMLGFVGSFVLGMGMSMAGVYIILAVTLAPAMIKLGLDPLASHLFVIYGADVSYITPPVALGAYVAAGIAKANPIKTGFQAMRLGMVIYAIPFLFAVNPALILHGSLLEILWSISFVSVGLFPLVGMIEGFIIGIGRLNVPLRVVSGFSCVFLFVPCKYLGLPLWVNILGALILLSMIPLRAVPGFRWQLE